MQLIATTTLAGKPVSDDFQAFLQESGIPLVKRDPSSLEELVRVHAAEGVVVWQDSGPVLHIQGEKFYFHPSMAKNRLSMWRKKGIPDPLVTACGFTGSDRVLDGTLGLGADAIVAAFFTPNGQVLALESSAAVACVVKWGMKLYRSRMPWLDEAIHRIQVIQAEHGQYLASQTEKSFDIVYFDPMFRKPQLKSQSLAPLRRLANPDPLSLHIVEEAVRVARKRVVIKEMFSSGELERLGCHRILGSANKKIRYGIIETDDRQNRSAFISINPHPQPL